MQFLNLKKSKESRKKGNCYTEEKCLEKRDREKYRNTDEREREKGNGKEIRGVEIKPTYLLGSPPTSPSPHSLSARSSSPRPQPRRPSGRLLHSSHRESSELPGRLLRQPPAVAVSNALPARPFVHLGLGQVQRRAMLSRVAFAVGASKRRRGEKGRQR